MLGLPPLGQILWDREMHPLGTQTVDICTPQRKRINGILNFFIYLPSVRKHTNFHSFIFFSGRTRVFDNRIIFIEETYEYIY